MRAVSRAGSTSQKEIRLWIIEALAEVRVVDLDELIAEIELVGDDFEIDSKEAEVILCILEYRLNQELARPDDLEPEELTTLGSLLALVLRRYVP
jgi:hypothetical protein